MNLVGQTSGGPQDGVNVAPEANAVGVGEMLALGKMASVGGVGEESTWTFATVLLALPKAAQPHVSLCDSDTLGAAILPWSPGWVPACEGLYAAACISLVFTATGGAFSSQHWGSRLWRPVWR